MVHVPYDYINVLAPVATQRENAVDELLHRLEAYTSDYFTPSGAQEYLKLIVDIYEAGAEPLAEWYSAAHFVQGRSLSQLGRELGSSYETTRNYIARAHPNVNITRIRAARHAIEAEETHLLERAVLNWSYHNPGRPGEEAERIFGIDKQRMMHLLDSRAKMHYSLARHNPQNMQRWSDKEILSMLGTWWAQEEVHSGSSFSRWSAERGGPTAQTVALRFGKWSIALEKAGLTNGASSYRYYPRYREEDLWAALIEYLRSTQLSYSYKGFARYCSQHAGMPSAASLRRRVGVSWSALLEDAKSIIAGTYTGREPEWVADIMRPRVWELINPTKAKPSQRDHETTAYAALHHYLEDTGARKIVAAAYDRWSRVHGEPRATTLTHTTGKKWSELVAAAGAVTGTRGGEGISREKILEDLVAYAAIAERWKSEEYRQWAREEGRTSLTTVLERCGGWQKALLMLAQHKGLIDPRPVYDKAPEQSRAA